MSTVPNALTINRMGFQIGITVNNRDVLFVVAA